jgi:hypothetical protein
MKASTLNLNRIKAAGFALVLALGLAVTPAISYAAHDGDRGRSSVKEHNHHHGNFKVKDKRRNHGKEVVILHNNGRYLNNRVYKHYRDRRYYGHHDRVRTVVIHEPVYREVYTDIYDDPRLSIGLHTGHFDLYFEN